MPGISVKLVIPSEIRLVDLAHAASEKVAEAAGLDDDAALNVALAVREAVINAILHGNRQDPGRSVELTLSASADRLTASVTDQGEGFDPGSTPDPTSGANLLRTSGRGLLMIGALVDKVKIRRLARGGMRVTMVKRLAPTGRARKDSRRIRG